MVNWTQKTWEKFWSKVVCQVDEEACRDWSAGRFPPQGKEPLGYGAFYYKGRNHAAHRIAYAMWHDLPVEGLDTIGHTCNRPPCCNPRHLTHGTQGENLAHMRECARSLYGENNPKARLTEEIVQNLVRRYAQGDVSAQTLADALGVSKSTVLRAMHGKTWDRTDTEDIEHVFQQRKSGDAKRRTYTPFLSSCEVCGKEIECLLPTKRYCSAVCQRKAYYSKE